MRQFGSILTVLALAYAGFLALIYALPARLIYFPVRELAVPPQARGLQYEDVYIDTEDGVRLNAWFVPARPERAVLLYFHGNAGNISHRVERTALFHRLGLSVLVLDYRGYGRSGGAPSGGGTSRHAPGARRRPAPTRG